MADESVVEEVGEGIGIAIQLIGIAAKLAPSVGSWLSGLVEGKSDPISLRVADILPAKSASRAAEEQLGG